MHFCPIERIEIIETNKHNSIHTTNKLLTILNTTRYDNTQI